MKTLTRLSLCALTPAFLHAAPDLPPLVFPEGVGVNIHFTRGHERDLDLIAAAGFKFIRMDFTWGGTERKKGEYDWSAYDELTGNLEKRGLRALYILDYSNRLYEDEITSPDPISGRERRDIASPRKPESVAGFARWAAAAAAHFKGRRIVWEIWNEPNISFWKPKPNVKDYTALVLATCEAVRAADPQATIIAPATSGFPWTFFEELFQAGTLRHLDAVSVHPYRGYSNGPETAVPDYLRLRTIIERHAPPGKKDMKIISGEWGYATHAKGGVSLDVQAAFIARQQIINLWQGVPISIWYDWKNDGNDPNYNEHNFGTVSNNLALKPSYVAVQTLTRQLSGFHVARRLETTTNTDFVFLLLNTAGQQKIAAWTTGKPHPVQLALGLSRATDFTAVDGQGQPLAVTVDRGTLTLDLQSAPQYITLANPSPVLRAAAAWSIDGFVPARVTAGGTNGLTVPIRVTNVFSTPASVNLAIDSGLGTNSKTVRLNPRQSTSHTFALQPRNRVAAPTPYTVSVEFQQSSSNAPERALGRSSELRHFVVANPLNLTAAPLETGWRVVVENPARTAFTGTAVVNGRAWPVQLNAGDAQQVLTAPGSAAGDPATALVELLDENKEQAVDLCRLQRLAVSGWKAALDGDAKVPATASIVETDAPGDALKPSSRALRLDYTFDPGWRFVRCVATIDRPIALPPGAKALGIWIHGDNSGNALRMRMTDAAGQTFQPSGPNLDWSGWRWVQFDLQNLSQAGHWGGANDGVVRGELRLDTLLLVDGSRNKTAGTIYFAGPTIVN